MSFITDPLVRFADWATHPSQKKYVYDFNEGSIEDTVILGHKGASLCDMTRLGLPVPEGFIISAEACHDFMEPSQPPLPQLIVNEYIKHVREIERKTSRMFGGRVIENAPASANITKHDFPLLLSIRSSQATNRSGMTETILNLGINDDVVEAMASYTNNARFAHDTYRRFIQMYGEVVLGVEKRKYEDIIRNIRSQTDASQSPLTLIELKLCVEQFKAITDFPADPWEQLRMAIEHIFNSWHDPKASTLREMQHYTDHRHSIGTAVIVQSMVYGNLNGRSGCGIAFTRNPGTGENLFCGEYLTLSEGEELLTTYGENGNWSINELKTNMPAIYDQLARMQKQLESHYRDLQEIEFTIEGGHLYVLETRRAKRTPIASVKVAVDMVRENLINEREALLRIHANDMSYFLHPMVDPSLSVSSRDISHYTNRLIGLGLPASAGAITGVICFTTPEVIALKSKGKATILCKEFTTDDDLEGMKAADGVMTLKGGLTSHTAMAMRRLGKSAVVGVQGMNFVRNDTGELKLVVISSDATLSTKVDSITIDGSSGKCYYGEIPTTWAGADENFRTVMRWADMHKRLKILAEVESPEDCHRAMMLGAQGVGLCRTEAMFFNPERIDLFRMCTLCDSNEANAITLAKLQADQQADFVDMFRTLDATSKSSRDPNTVSRYRGQVTIRLLDSPAQDFLPNPRDSDFEEQVADLATRLGDNGFNVDVKQLTRKILDYQESNLGMGLRGVRMGIAWPELYQMQVRAIIGAAIKSEIQGVTVKVEILVPMVSSEHEVQVILPTIKAAADAMCELAGVQVDYSVGCLLGCPRALLKAGAIASKALLDNDVVCDSTTTSLKAKNLPTSIRFCHIQTDTLTQLVYGFSQADYGTFLQRYKDAGILTHDPFTTLDKRGVGSLIHHAVVLIHNANKACRVGICGQLGSDPESIQCFENWAMDYITCAPYMIPVAMVAAAQDEIRQAEEKARTEQLRILNQIALM